MREQRHSECPVNFTPELLGDRWGLIVIRDIMFGNRRHYGDLLRLSEEGISARILAGRLARLLTMGLLTRRRDPAREHEAIYSLTEASIELVPLMANMIAWGRKHTAAAKNPPGGSIRGQLVEEGGKRVWKDFMAELKADHLGAPRPRRSAFARRLAALESPRQRAKSGRAGDPGGAARGKRKKSR